MITEAELYPPLKEYFCNQGYTVRGEVRSCDLAATRDGELVLVEMKTALNLELLLQGNERKRLCDNVYLAIPLPAKIYSPRWRKILRLCRSLGLGLITVSAKGLIQVHCQPQKRAPAKSSRGKKLLLAEFWGRSGDYNLGGSKGLPLVTVYREKALTIADYIGDQQKTLKDIRETTGLKEAGPILQKNHYGWYERSKRGVYCLSPLGQAALQKYAPVLATIRRQKHGQ